jgi:hypothetical protein
VNLTEENVRHSRAMGAVAVQEIRRWQLLAFLNETASMAYEDLVPKTAAHYEREKKRAERKAKDLERLQKQAEAEGKPRPTTHPASSRRIRLKLFADRAATQDWMAWDRQVSEESGIPATQPRQPATAAQTQPAISDGDQILNSLRRLADAARAWQKASPNEFDPRGWNAHFSQQRLQRGIEVVNAHVLSTSVNERFATESSVRLRAELEEHDIHLDGLQARVDEAELRLGLGDVLAFHQTGITDEDLQAGIGILQSTFLAIIAGRI